MRPHHGPIGDRAQQGHVSHAALPTGFALGGPFKSGRLCRPSRSIEGHGPKTPYMSNSTP